MTHADFGAVLFNVCHKFACIFCGKVFASCDHHRPNSCQANWLKVVNRAIGQIFNHQYIRGVANVNHQ